MDDTKISHFERVSDEILLQIFSNLRHEDILKISRVNKRFHRIAEDSSLHKYLLLDKSGENLYLSENILKNYINKYGERLQSFVFVDCYWIKQRKLVKFLGQCRNLKELNLIGCEVSLQALDLLFQSNRSLTKLGWSLPSKDFSEDLFHDGRQSPLYKRLQDSLMRLKSLKLRFFRILCFEALVCLFPNEMTLNELSIEYRGKRPTSIIHAGTDYNVHIKSNHPFPAYLNKLHLNNRYLHFNLVLMDFVTKVVLHAAETDQLTVLIAPGGKNSLCWKYIAPSYRTSLLTKIDLSSTCLTAEQMNWLGNLGNLTYLNLQHVQDFKLNLMKAIASNCPKLESLNLNNSSDWVDEDLCALKIVSSSCKKLKALNLGKICCHSNGSTEDNRLCNVVATMNELKSLSISPCSLVNSSVDHVIGSPEVHLKKTTARRSSLVDASSPCASSSIFVSAGYVTRHVTHQQKFNERVLQFGSGLDKLVSGLKKIEDFEMIDVGYSSVFSIPDECAGLSFVCPVTRRLHDAAILAIKSWTRLKKLTVAGLPGLGSFNSLIEIANHCKDLEFLSLANIGLPGHSGVLSSLPQALKNCHNLKRLRLDQAHYQITERFLNSLQECKNLEAVCIICKDAKIPKDVAPYEQLFDACRRLCVLQLFSGASATLCKKIQRELIKRYQKTRPALSIAILPFSLALTDDGLENIPFPHLKNLTCFESRIATMR